MNIISRNSRGLLLAGSLMAISPIVLGSGYQELVALQEQSVSEARVAQESIDTLAEQMREMRHEYKVAARRLASLQSYNDNLAEMVDAQSEEMASLDAQLDRIDETNQELVPLMTRMLATLEEFVERDAPFLPDERSSRLIDLRDLMASPGVSISEKYRRLLEAYQVEAEYGSNLEAYRGEIDLAGQSRNVQFLRVGRVALIYQTLDGRETGFWHPGNAQWVALDDGYRKAVSQAIRIAQRQTAPDMIRVPVIMSSEGYQ